MQLREGIDVRPATYDEYVGWPRDAAPLEVVDGHPIVSPLPGGPHQLAASRLTVLFDQALPEGLEVLGPWDWVLRKDPLLVRQPDLLVVPSRQAREARLTHPPLLAVEILSADSHERDLVTKRREYAAAGLGWYWVVSLEPAQVLVFTSHDGDLVPHAEARGDQALAVEQPFAVQVQPSRLAAPRTSR